MNESSLNRQIDEALDKIRTAADSNTAIGEPIRLNDEVVVLPFSKISVGYGAGGSDIGKKKDENGKTGFVGGNGAGISVTPMGFIIVNGTDVRVVNLSDPTAGINPVSQAVDGINTLVDKVPGIIDKIKGKRKTKKEEQADAE